jgi:hypothetical protein
LRILILKKKIPFGSQIILLPKFDPELRKLNLKTGKKLEKSGNKVIYIKIEKLKPRILSRIDGIKFEMARTI